MVMGRIHQFAHTEWARSITVAAREEEKNQMHSSISQSLYDGKCFPLTSCVTLCPFTFTFKVLQVVIFTAKLHIDPPLQQGD